MLFPHYVYEGLRIRVTPLTGSGQLIGRRQQHPVPIEEPPDSHLSQGFPAPEAHELHRLIHHVNELDG